MDSNYKNIIWTKHALERMRGRGIRQSDAWVTFNNPDRSRYAKTKGAWVYYKAFGGKRMEVVAKKNEEGKWIILSVWSGSINTKQAKARDGFSISRLLGRVFGT